MSRILTEPVSAFRSAGHMSSRLTCGAERVGDRPARVSPDGQKKKKKSGPRAQREGEEGGFRGFKD